MLVVNFSAVADKMSALTVSREVRIPRRRGLMARALEQRPEVPKDSANLERFDSAILLDTKSVETNLNRTSTNEASQSAPRKLKPTLSITFPEESPPESANTSPVVPSPSPDPARKRRISKQVSGESLLNPIQENARMNEETFSSTQHLRTGFFRTIKKQYPTAAFENLGLGDDCSVDSGRGESIGSPRGLNHSYDNPSLPASGTSFLSDLTM